MKTFLNVALVLALAFLGLGARGARAYYYNTSTYGTDYGQNTGYGSSYMPPRTNYVYSDYNYDYGQNYGLNGSYGTNISYTSQEHPNYGYQYNRGGSYRSYNSRMRNNYFPRQNNYGDNYSRSYYPDYRY